ncbi:hypothetical protein N7541_008581 [Penicillium brevicompactum]|uniref:Uncharacterized protein n=1 Tax=Penicillium brevicompactum TaxID=5074 RepID=A0A9W9R2A9_PENBR|nr:hypothetical protein N7541_008581 [Penicillium brevicompactum]
MVSTPGSGLYGFAKSGLTQSCKYWAQNTIKLQYRALEEVDREHQHGRECQREASHLGTDISGPSTQRTASSSFAISLAATALGKTSGEIHLYRGMDKSLVNKPLSDDGNVQVNFLAVRPPADFTSRTVDLDLHADRKVAEHDAFENSQLGH